MFTNFVNHLVAEYWRVLKISEFFLELGDVSIGGNLQNIPHHISIEIK